jgi:L-gulonolactone oxidase
MASIAAAIACPAAVADRARSRPAEATLVADKSVVSWGRLHHFDHKTFRPAFRDQLAGAVSEALLSGSSVLPVGLGRSYGDSGLNGGQALLHMAGLDRLLAFDPASGLLDVECGISLSRVLDFAIPRGFFLPVVPGTAAVTVGGAIANDVHGKNHYSAGTFGCWVREIELLRTDGSVHIIRPDDATGLFAATIGGLGLTGIMLRARLELRPIASAQVDRVSVSFSQVADYFALSRQYIGQHEHTVAWIDGSSAAGRGLFTMVDHRNGGDLRSVNPTPLGVPFYLPDQLLNRSAIGLMNVARSAQNRLRSRRAVEGYRQSLFPLDALRDWNRLYGRRGFYQYQCVLGQDVAEPAAAEILAAIHKSNCPPLLVVAKTFGPHASPGLLSFPKPGTTLALDFPNFGEPLLALFKTLDRIVQQSDGRLYPAKDARMSAAMFRSGYPALGRFAAHVDPGISSSFWRRVGA